MAEDSRAAFNCTQLSGKSEAEVTIIEDCARGYYTVEANYCDSGLDSIESPGILTIINGPEHDELSLVYLHLSCITWGPTCQLYP